VGQATFVPVNAPPHHRSNRFIKAAAVTAPILLVVVVLAAFGEQHRNVSLVAIVAQWLPIMLRPATHCFQRASIPKAKRHEIDRVKTAYCRVFTPKLNNTPFFIFGLSCRHTASTPITAGTYKWCAVIGKPLFFLSPHS